VGEITVLQLIDSVSQRASAYRDQDHTKDNSEKERVQRLQRTLAGLGFYDGEVDGLAGKRTSHALHKLEEKSGLELDGVHGPKTQQARAQFDQTLWDPTKARWTAVASEGSMVRFWRMDPLLKLCRSNSEMRGVLRKVFSQSAIKKTLVMHKLVPDEPERLHGDRPGAGKEALRRYEAALRGALGGRTTALPEDKLALAQFRRQQGINDAQHAWALKVAIGWTPQEYELGAPLANVGDPGTSRAAQLLQEGLAAESDSSEECTGPVAT